MPRRPGKHGVGAKEGEVLVPRDKAEPVVPVLGLLRTGNLRLGSGAYYGSRRLEGVGPGGRVEAIELPADREMVAVAEGGA